MALVNRDRVLETSTTTGTGTYTLAGAVTGFQDFSVVGNGNTCHYAAWEVDGSGNPSGGWETGLGTYTASGTTLARTTVIASSNAGAAVNWAAGTRRIAVSPLSSKVPTTDAANTFSDTNTFAAATTYFGASAVAATARQVAPDQGASAAAGNNFILRGSDAIAGNTNAGAAAGGAVSIIAGSAARLTSGNANGGNINLLYGTLIGSGTTGKVVIRDISQSAGSNELRFYNSGTHNVVEDPGSNGIRFSTNNGTRLSEFLGNGGLLVPQVSGTYPNLGAARIKFAGTSGGIEWATDDNSITGSVDTGVRKSSAGVVEINTGTVGQWGSLKAGTRDAGTTTITDGLTLGHQSTGTPAAGLGVAIQFNINSSTTADQSASRLTSSWETATHASRTSQIGLWSVTNAGALAEVARFDGGGGATPTAGNTGMMLWDVDNATLERVTVGAADSGGTGYKVLRIPN